MDKLVRLCKTSRIQHRDKKQDFLGFKHRHVSAFTGSIAAVSLIGAALKPAEWATTLVVPFLLASTVEGLLLGNAVPKQTAKFVHPLITCSLFANLAAAVFGKAAGWSYKQSLRLYLMKVAPLPPPTSLFRCLAS